MEKAGDRIPGSQYVRAFCSVCREPIRVSPRTTLTTHYCKDCETKPTEHVVSLADLCGNNFRDDQYIRDNAWDDAVKAYEGAD